MNTTEYVVWGCTSEDKDESILLSKMPECFGMGDAPITDALIANQLAEACSRAGATSVRVQKVDIDDPFAGWMPAR